MHLNHKTEPRNGVSDNKYLLQDCYIRLHGRTFLCLSDQEEYDQQKYHIPTFLSA